MAPTRGWSRPRAALTGTTVPPLGVRLQLVRASLVMLFMLSFSLLLQLTVISQLQQRAAQQRAFDHFRSELAIGTAPTGPTDWEGKPLTVGTPVAYLEIPSLGLHQVVGEGTTSASLFDGPGHRRDTPLPGQQGVSMVLGRSSAFGGPFSGIDGLDPGDEIKVTTGQGQFTFEVIGVRKEGDPSPAPPEEGAGRLLLVTSEGPPFLPDGVLRVDADLVGKAAVGPPRVLTADTLPSEERIMAGDARTLWALALWLLVVLGLTLGVMWAWHRLGRARTWVIFFPPMLFVSLAASGEVARLLPNLL